MTITLPPHRFGSSGHHKTLKQFLRFELKSLVGRLLSQKIRTPTAPLLQIGSGINPLGGFENVDFYSTRFWRPTRHVGHDLRFPLPYRDKTFSGAFSEHTLEHLYPSQAIQLLKEIHRVLVPGAIFRCAVPDLRKYMEFYQGKLPNKEFSQFHSGCEAIWSLTQNWDHLSVWDAEMLGNKLLEAGFSEVKQRNYREGANTDLLQDLEYRKWETLYVEAVR